MKFLTGEQINEKKGKEQKIMYSKRFRNKIKELGSKKVNDWFVFACWRANIRAFPNIKNPLFEKYIGE